MSERGSIYLHCDEKKSHHLRVLMDEVFGEATFAAKSSGTSRVLSGIQNAGQKLDSGP